AKASEKEVGGYEADGADGYGGAGASEKEVGENGAGATNGEGVSRARKGGASEESEYGADGAGRIGGYEAELPESIGYGDSGKKESYKERNPPSLQPKRVAYIDSDLSASSYTGAFTPGQDNPQINGKVRNGNGRKSDGVDKGYDESMRESDGNSYDEERGTRNENKQGDLEDDQQSYDEGELKKRKRTAAALRKQRG
uniref:Uncharacterized protein n=1 Tax=Parascaris univalens TaxID=6257 RepID=A0A915A9K3_PARUN